MTAQYNKLSSLDLFPTPTTRRRRVAQSTTESPAYLVGGTQLPEQNHPNHHDEVPVSYWLNVANALQGVQELFSASTRDEYFQILDRYPILALPEMPNAIIAFISNHPDESAKKFGSSRAKTLKTIQQAIREHDRD